MKSYQNQFRIKTMAKATDDSVDNADIDQLLQFTILRTHVL